MDRHGARKHSKYSASGAERWVTCPGSVDISEGLPSRDSAASKEGTKGHEVLESILRVELSGHDGAEVEQAEELARTVSNEMFIHGRDAAQFILGVHQENERSELLVETRVALPFIHKEMFGTFDGAVLDYFGTLHVFDYKYGKYAVSPVENLQEIIYGLGLSALHHWNFKRVRLWIIQPRAKGYDGPTFWELSMKDLREYVSFFKEAVRKTITQPNTYKEGEHCFFCPGRSICPLKTGKKLEKAKSIFKPITKGKRNG